jgi:hypothetical protein
MDVHRAVSRRLPVGLLVNLSRLGSPIGGLKRQLIARRWRLMERTGVAFHCSRSASRCVSSYATHVLFRRRSTAATTAKH